MKIIITKTVDTITASIEENSELVSFEYVKLIDHLYQKKPVDIEVVGFDDNTKNKIVGLFDEIKSHTIISISD